MQPVSPVLPGENLEEIIVAENQPEFLNLPVLKVSLDEEQPRPGTFNVAGCGEGVLLSRWTLSEEERQLIAATGELYLFIWSGGGGINPVMIQAEKPELIRRDNYFLWVQKYSESLRELSESIGIETLKSFCTNCRAEVLAGKSALEGVTGNVVFVCPDCVGEISAKFNLGIPEINTATSEELQKILNRG